MQPRLAMKAKILEQLTWKDLREIVLEADLALRDLKSIKCRFPSEDVYYKGILAKLKEKAE